MLSSIATPNRSAPQHGPYGPRPLPLFLDMVRSETAASPDRTVAVLAGLAAYQQAPRERPRTVMPARARKGRARLRDYGGDGRMGGPPVVFVPSLINPPVVLDLADDVSLVRWIAQQGFHAWLVDWGEPRPADRALDIVGHVERVLIPLLAKLPEPPILVGYCLGGTIALATALRLPIAGVATIAAPWRFDGYGDEARAQIAALWDAARGPCNVLGLVPVEVLQSAFWKLDPARTVAKYEAFAALDPTSEPARAFVRLEDWANAGAPLTYAAGAQLFAMIAQGRWPQGGDLSALACPAIEFVSSTDRIVPAATAAGLADRRDLASGHVGMIVGRRARATLWHPLADWLTATATRK